MKLSKLISGLFLLVCLVACSIQISDVTPAPAPTSTSPPSTPQAPTQTQTSTPPAWAHLQLTGRLLFTHGRLGIKQLDLATGALTNVFVPPAQGWLTAASVSPDGRQIVVAYAPPPPAGKVQLGYTDLYLMPTDGSAALTPLLQRTEAQESFFNPSWSPDGQYVYYAHFVIPTIGVTPEATPEFQPPRYTIERAPYPAGQPQVLVENAYWPTLARDGAKLAYVAFDPTSFANELRVANADGTNPVALLPAHTFEAVDAPLFSPDGSTLLFSAVGEGPPPALSWLDQLLGVRVASAAPPAHNVPSDWWSIPATGGTPQRLTRLYETGLFGSFAPDGDYFAFLSLTGLYVMRPDGSGITSLLNLEAFGTMEWIR